MAKEKSSQNKSLRFLKTNGIAKRRSIDGKDSSLLRNVSLSSPLMTSTKKHPSEKH